MAPTRTRRSNQTTRYTVQKYDFEDSSDEIEVNPGRRRRRKGAVDDDDDDDGDAFDESAMVAESAGDENDEDDDDDDGEPASHLPTSDVDMSDVEPRSKSKGKGKSLSGASSRRRRSKPTKPASSVGTLRSGYLDIEPMPTDGHPLRGYAGPYDRSFRGQVLVNCWYGPRRDRIELIQDMLDQWQHCTVLPPRSIDGPAAPAGGGTSSPWATGFAAEEARAAEPWLRRMKDALAVVPVEEAWWTLSPEDALPYRMPPRQIPVLLGPPLNQLDVKFSPGDACPLSQSCSPLNPGDPEANVPTGWLLDCGGIVVGMDWAPRRRSVDASGSFTPTAQLLALAVIPHADQEPYDYVEETSKPDFERFGVVQLWEFEGEMAPDGIAMPSARKPTLRRTICHDQGRARRIRWSPLGGYLAILCGDGKVYIAEPREGGNGEHDLLRQPVAVLSLASEEVIKATSMAWVGVNRLVIGYSDGSIALWSIGPTRLMSRHPVHHNAVVSVASGYPSMPYVITSIPIGGTAKVVDLRSPSYETTAAQSLLINPQPNLLAYSDHLLGFFSIFPSSNALNTVVGFMHHSSFPLVRRVFTGESFLTCLSVGRTHPYLLIGMTDGSLWALNPMVELFTSRREPSDRVKVFKHEHRPYTLFPADSPAAARGASRILQGFAMEKNHNPRTETKATTGKAAGKKPKPAKKPGGAQAATADDNDEEAVALDPSRGVIHEPLTRITVVEWNPNEGYGCWAACAMGSGLVRVMDLGVESV